MNLPKKMIDNLYKASKLYAKAQMLVNEVDDYITSQGFDTEDYRGGDGISLEEIEYSAGDTTVVAKFIIFAKNDFDFDKTWAELKEKGLLKE